MNLRSWITADLAAIRTRFEHGIAAVVPLDRWSEPVPSPTEQHRATSTISGLLLHMSYHHDLAVSTAILDRPPLMSQWRDRLGLASLPPEIGLAERESRDAVELVDAEALAAYFGAVNDLTAAWVSKVATVAFDSTAPNCRRLVQRAGVTPEAVPWFHAMWDAKTVGWLVQWEAVAHPYSHLGEMTAIRNQMGLSPF